MPATIRDIAKMAGVSHPTVSRVLNGKGKDFISEQTKKRVLDTAKKMGYRPNMAARSLKLNKSGLVGILGIPPFGEGGVYYHVIDSLVQEFRAQNMDVMIGFNRKGLNASMQEILPSWKIEGAIVFPGIPGNLLTHLEEFAIPFVQFNCCISESHSAIMPDDEQGMADLIKKLKNYGHDKIAYASPSELHHISVKIRSDAFFNNIRKNKIEAIQSSANPIRETKKFISDVVLEGSASVIVTYDHLMALDILRVAKENGLNVPADFSLVCFNDVFPVDRVFPQISAVRIPAEEMGLFAAQTLIEEISGNGKIKIVKRLFPETLIVRTSLKSIK